MALDLYRDRRKNFIRCEYWKRDVSFHGDNNKLIHETQMAGIFYARPVGDRSNSDNNVAGVFSVNQNELSLETSDSVNINAKDIIKFNNQIWYVERLTQTLVNKNTEFSKAPSKITILYVKRGE